MKTIIKFLDFLSPLPNLKIDKEDRFKNLLGGTISILSSILIISLTVYFSKELLTRTKSSIIFNYAPNENQSQNISNFPYALVLTNSYGQPLADDSRVYSVYSVINTLYTNYSSTTPITTIKTQTIEQEKCDINKHFGNYTQNFKNIPFLSSFYCQVPHANNLTINSTFGSINAVYMAHHILRCVNDTSKNITNCRDPKYIESTLATAFVGFWFLEYSLNHDSIAQPGYITLRSDALPSSSTVYSRNWYYITNIAYRSDMGLIFEDILEQKYFYYTRPTQTVDLTFQGTLQGGLASIFISMDQKYEVYKRYFTKIQNLIADIGGMIKGVITVSQIIVYYFNTNL